MSGLVGKGSRSFKKQAVGDSNLPALGIKNFLMAFEQQADLVAGGSITLADSALVVPPEMLTNGFQQPSGPEITNAQLGTFRNNVTVSSNLNGVLLDRIAYTITNETITFIDGLNADEIITIKRGNEVVTGNRIVDARPLRASGTVDFSTIGSSPVVFQTGEGFRIAPSTTATGGIDNRQIGFVQVYVDGVLQARNVGNADESTNAMATQTGNYREVLVNTATNAVIDPQNGVTANAVQFNQFQPFSSMEGVIVISTNLIVDAPNSTGVLDQIDSVQAQVTANDVDIAANTGNIATNTAAIAGFSSGGGGIVPVGARQVSTSTNQGNAAGTSAGAQVAATWVAPTDVTSVFVQMAGGGSSGQPSNTGSAGGGAAAYFEGWLTVVPGATYNIQLGQGGGSFENPQGGGDGNAGAATTFTGTINGIASAIITCNPGSGNTVGDVSFTNLNFGGAAPQTGLSASTYLRNSIHPIYQDFNENGVWRSGPSGGGVSGGATVLALGGASGGSPAAGGGGAGFFPGTAQVGGGNSGPGGSGGVRILWYSNLAASTAAMHPIS